MSLATTDRRIEADYILPDDDSDTPHSKYLFSDEYEITGAELHYRDGEWVLHIHCKKEVESDTSEKATPENGTVLGVDLGVNNLAVTSTGMFWTGNEFDHWRREYEKRRGDLQQCGTRWAHGNIQFAGGKEDGRFKSLLHRISNELVGEARENWCSVIAFEELTNIRERTGASWGHKWAFNRLSEYVEYKAEEHGIRVEQVDPENTSRRCSHCGFTHPDNRTGEEFECQKREYENHADYNAAKNIGLRYLRRNQTGDRGGAPLGVRLNSGTLNVNGGYSPASTESERESTLNPTRLRVGSSNTTLAGRNAYRTTLFSHGEYPPAVGGERGTTLMTELNDSRNRDRTGYDPMTDTYHHQYDWDSPERLSSAIIAAVATVTDTEPTELEPLYDCVDPDALDALFRPLSEDRPRSHGRLSFSLDEYEVTVQGHGEIIVDVSDINTSGGGRAAIKTRRGRPVFDHSQQFILA